MQIDEVALTQKAGIIPYYIDEDGIPMMMFMVPSNPNYGGTEYQIAKGHIDKGETHYKAAIREGKEGQPAKFLLDGIARSGTWYRRWTNNGEGNRNHMLESS